MPTVGCELRFDLRVDTVLGLQVAALDPTTERFDVGTDVTVSELATSGRGRIHVVRAPAGPLRIGYEATADPIVPAPAVALDEEQLRYRRQSRYCPSDALEGFAERTFADEVSPFDVATWVFGHLAYVAGSSDGLDTAVDTLLAGRGVCRDFAHLTVALCRALGFPARLVAVYAPGLEPMDFHAVAEVSVDGAWQIHDATRLVETDMLVRICTGRDAADTAFASTISGDAALVSSSVFARNPS